MKKLLSVLFVLFTVGFASAQDDLLNQLDTVKSKQKEISTSAFKGLQIGNMQSTKMVSKGDWYVLVSHRFGDLTHGLDNFFGLDDANTKLGGIWGATDWLSIGFSRHTYNKIYEIGLKYRLASQQDNGFPITIAVYNTFNVNTKLDKDVYPGLEFSDRLAYSTQLLISRKVSESLSLEVTPMYIHKNLYDPVTEKENQFTLGAGGRYKLTKRLSLNVEYALRMDNQEGSIAHNPLTAGLDIETGGHIFQLVFSNTQVMDDVSVFSNQAGKLDGGGIFFGFNMYRVF
jgi:hypothetical protein